MNTLGKTMLKVTTAATAAVFMATTFVTASPAPAEAASNVNNSTVVNDIFKDLNKFRKSKGAPAVKYNTKIESVSKETAVKMANKDSYNINGNPYFVFDNRIADGWSDASEVIQYNSSSSGKSIAQTFVADSPNRSIVQSKKYTHIGIGTAKGKSGRTYAVVNFLKYSKDPSGTKTSPTPAAKKPAPKYKVSGAIGKKYAKVKSKLGSPTSNSKKIKSGYIQYFQKGYIYYKKSSGTRVVYKKSSIGKKYVSLKHANGKLGFPKSDEKKLKRGAYQKFEKGKIYWSKTTGSREVYYGAIHTKWAKTKYEKGKLGYPTSGQHKYKGKLKQKFQKGYITYSKKSGAKVYYNKKR